ncbi:hypothetical protein FI667_g6523, partial [Globisporangium splendens]
MRTEGGGMLDMGTSNNFVRSHVVREPVRASSKESHSSGSKINVRLVTGATVTTEKHVTRLRVTHDGRQMEGDFFWLDLDDNQSSIGIDNQLDTPATKRKQANRPSARNALAVSEHGARVCDGPLSTIFEDEATRKSQGQASEVHRSVQKSGDEGKVPPMETSDQGSSCEVISVMVTDEDGSHIHEMALGDPPKNASKVMTLPIISQKRFMKELHQGTLEQICYIAPREASGAESAVQRHLLDECFLASSSVMDTDVLDESTKKERSQAQ